MDPNPYEASILPCEVKSAIGNYSTDSNRDLLRIWELRRLWFNGWLVGVTLFFGTVLGLLILTPRFWAFAVQGAIVANVCFCVGPIVNWHVARFGFDQNSVGKFLFWIGTGFSVLLTMVSIVVSFTQDFLD